MRRIIAILIVIVLLLTLMSGCRREPEKPEDQLIYYRIDAEPITLDPQIADDAGARLVIMNIYEGLVRLGENNSIIPGAAESWEVSKDQLMYSFHIRQDARWNDGSPLTAGDFLYGFRRTFRPETGSGTAGTLFCIKNSEKVRNGFIDETLLGVFVSGEDTLIIQLEHPEPDFLELLTTPPAMPCRQDFFEKTAGQYGRDADKLLTNGAFCIRKYGWEHNNCIYLRKNQEYCGQEIPVPAGVNIVIGKSEVNTCEEIRNGTIDCGEISAGEIRQAEQLGLTLQTFGDTVWGILLNTKNDVLKNTKLRLGLLGAVDRKKLSLTFPEGWRVTGNIIPDSAMLGENSYRMLAGNTEVLRKKSAAEMIGEGLREEGWEAFPELTVLCPDDEQTQKLVSDLIEVWNRLTGSYINKKPVPVSELRDRIASGEYMAAIAPLTVTGMTPLGTLELFESGNRYISALESEEYDKLTEQIRRDMTVNSLGKMTEAENYLIQKGVFYPMYAENRYFACSPQVRGILFHPYGAKTDFFFAAKRNG